MLLWLDTVRGFEVEAAALSAPEAAEQIGNRLPHVIQNHAAAMVITAQIAAAYRATRTVEVIDHPRTVRPFFLPVPLHNQHIRKRPLSFFCLYYTIAGKRGQFLSHGIDPLRSCLASRFV